MPFFRRRWLAVSLGAGLMFGAANDAAAQSANQRAEAQAVRAARAAQNDAIAAGDQAYAAARLEDARAAYAEAVQAAPTLATVAPPSGPTSGLARATSS